MQVSPSGMAAASQAVPGEFDSRHLLQKQRAPFVGALYFWKIKDAMTRVEGGAVCGSKGFALLGLYNGRFEGKGGNW